MKYINYILLAITICISICLFFFSANQVEIIPNKNANFVSEQIMNIEKSTDINQLKTISEEAIIRENDSYKKLSNFAAKLNSWIILLFILQLAMATLSFIQYRKKQKLNQKI